MLKLLPRSISWMCLLCFAGSALCDRGTSLSQLRGLFHSVGPHHWSRGQRHHQCLAVCCCWCCCNLLIVHVNPSRRALCRWWSFPMWASCLEAGPQSCGTTFWPMSRGWANTLWQKYIFKSVEVTTTIIYRPFYSADEFVLCLEDK